MGKKESFDDAEAALLFVISLWADTSGLTSVQLLRFVSTAFACMDDPSADVPFDLYYAIETFGKSAFLDNYDQHERLWSITARFMKQCRKREGFSNNG